MVEITRTSTSETQDPRLAEIRSGISQVSEPVSLFDEDIQEQAPWTEAMGAAWMNDTMIGHGIDAVRQLRDRYGASIDPEFNPYKFYEDNKGSYDFLTPADVYESGYFANAQSEQHFQTIANQLSRERDRRDVMASTSLIGTLAGMVGVNADLLFLVPGASVVRGGSAIRAAAKGGVIGAGVNLGVEATGQAAQVDRETDGIGLIAGLGAGLGAGVGLATQLVANRNLAGRVSDAVRGRDNEVIEVPAGVDSVGGSVGAAKVETPETLWTNVGPISKAIGWLQYKVPLFRSTSSVAQFAESKEARYAFDRLTDTGLTTDGPQRIRAEEVQREITRGGDVAMYKAASAFRKAQAKGDVDPAQFEREIYKMLALGENYRPNVPYLAELTEAKDALQSHFKEVGERAVKAGILREEQIMDNYVVQGWVRHRIMEDKDGFTELLLRNYETEMDEEWLMSRHGLTVEQFRNLEDASRSQRIMDEWNVAHQEIVADRLEASVDRMRSELKELQRELAEVSRAWRSAGTADKKALARVSETFGRTYENWRTAKQTTMDTMKAEQEFLFRSSEALRQAKLARDNALVEIPNENSTTYKAWQRWQKAEQKILDFWGDPSKWAPRRGKEEIRHGRSKETRWEDFDRSKLETLLQRRDKARAAFEKAYGRPVVAPEDPRLGLDDLDPRVQFLKGRATELDVKMRELDKRMQQAQRRHAEWSAKHEQAILKKQEIEQTLEMAKAARSRYLDTAKNLRKALKDEERQLKNAREFKPNREYVNDLVDALTGRDMFPSGMMIDMAGEESARAKFRKVKIKPELLDEFIEKGFLNTNLQGLVRGYSRDVGGRIGLSETFRGDHSLKETRKKIVSDYDRMIREAKTQGNEKKAEELRNQRDVVDNHIKEFREMMLGKYDFAYTPAEEWLMWFGRVARQWNFLRYLGMSTVSSLPDLASVSLANGVMRTVPKAFGNNIGRIAEKMSDRELALILHATENIPIQKMAIGQGSFSGNRWMGHDYTMLHGTGTGRAREITSKIEASTNWMSDKMSTWNLNRFWNGRLKYVAGHGAMLGLLEAGETVAKGGKLSRRQIRDAAILGLDEGDLKRFYELTQQHGEEIIEGFKLPNLDGWGSTREGAEMRRRFYTAVQRITDRAVTTPGLADTPLFMSKNWGKLLMQFQTFGFAFVNKWGRQMDTRLMNGEYAEAMMSLGWMAAGATAAYVIRNGVLRGEMNGESREQFFANLSNPVFMAREVVDRGGLLFFLSPYFNSAMKLAHYHGVPLDEWGMLPTRFRDHAWMSPLFGPTADLVDVTQRLATSQSGDQLWSNLNRIAPFGNLLHWEFVKNNAIGDIPGLTSREE